MSDPPTSPPPPDRSPGDDDSPPAGSGETPDAATPAPSRHAFAFILLTVFIDTIGFGIIAPVLPDLIRELTGEGLGAAARYGGLLMFVFAAMQFLFAPVMGGLSDHFGRRPVLLVSLMALGIDYALMGFAPTLAWLFVGRLLAGVFASTHATANAYAADVSGPADRAKSFGLIAAVWGVGFTVGPMIGGLVAGFGSRVPFFVAAALAVTNTLYGALVLPETLPLEKRRRFSLARANPVGALRQLRHHQGFLALFAAMAFYAIAHNANPSTWAYYTMEKFGWTPRDVGWSLGGVGICVMIVQGGLIGTIVTRLGERRAAIQGFGLMAASFLGFALATRGWMMYAWMFPFALGSIAMPALRALMSSRVGESEQGELAGAISSLMALMAIPAPIVMTQLFGYFTSPAAPFRFPGAAFVAAGALVLASAAIVQTARPVREVRA